MWSELAAGCAANSEVPVDLLLRQVVRIGDLNAAPRRGLGSWPTSDELRRRFFPISETRNFVENAQRVLL